LLRNETGLSKKDGGQDRDKPRTNGSKIKTGLVEVDATNLEENPVEKEVTAEQQVIPNEEAAVETITALKDWSGDRRLTVRCREQPKKRTKGDGGSWQK
jgi:hypothetical protein